MVWSNISPSDIWFIRSPEEALNRHIERLAYWKQNWQQDAREYIKRQPVWREISEKADWERCRTEIIRSLEYGETYFWDGPICELVGHASETLPEFSLQPSDVPSPYGFGTFARPYVMTAPRFDDYGELTNGVRIIDFLDYCWLTTSEGVMLYIHHIFVDQANSTGSTESLQVGVPLLWGQSWRLDAKGNTASEELAQSVAVVFAGWRFLQQKLLIASIQKPSRSWRRRHLRRNLIEPVLKVIRLRKVSALLSKTRNGESPEWSCQWLVRGHWRNQYYPKIKVYRPKWINAYIKGPEDKPLKASRAQVFAVVR